MECPDLRYASNPGCSAASSTAGGTPGQCGRVEEFAVPHAYRYPRPHRTRLYVCARHARLIPEAEPLTGRDRAIIRARHADRDAELRRAGWLDS